MKKQFLKLLAVTVCLVCALAAFSAEALAIDPIQMDAEVSLAVTFKVGEVSVPDAKFSVYRVADVSEFGQFSAVGEFASYVGPLTGTESASKWDEVASALTRYAAESGIKPLASAKTDNNGQVVLTGLKPGLYLIVCGETKYKDGIYTGRPCLICLPNRVGGADEWTYENVPLTVKGGVELLPSPPPDILPQTGMLWWPVFALALGGLLFILVGAARRKSCRSER